MADFENIIYDVEDNTGWITLNRPERLNALSRPLLAELEQALSAAQHDEEVRSIVIKGAGRAFSAGYDMNVQTQGERRRDALFSAISDGPQEMYKRAIWDNPKPVIAQVHSFTLAGGGHLACHCDITIASDDALFGYPPIRYASVMMPLIWPELVGMKKAKQLAFTGNMMTAQEALRVGLVSEVVPRDELDEHVKRLTRTIAKVPPESTNLNKLAINYYYEAQGLFQAIKFAGNLTNISYAATPDELPYGLQDVNRVTADHGMRAGFQYMNDRFVEEDNAVAASQMARPSREP
jgi:enoyl-CoA hydratase